MDPEINRLRVRSLIQIVLIDLLASYILTHSFAGAQERLRIAYAGGASVVPVWIVNEKGLLKRQGISGELIQISASSTALQALCRSWTDLVPSRSCTAGRIANPSALRE